MDDETFDELYKLIQQEQAKVFSKKVIAEFNDPKNVGRLKNSDAAGVVDGTCGDTIEMYIRIKKDTIEDISFFTDGCGATIACGSLTTQMAKGRTLEEALKITGDNLIFELDGLPDEHMHCAHLAVAALRRAIENYGGNDHR